MSKKSDERGTPAYIVNAARDVMGGIETDPASCAEANWVVQAGKFYDEETNGLEQEWWFRVWLNPPSSQPLCRQFIDKAIEEIEAGRVEQIIVLVNLSSGKHFHKLLERFYVAFPKKRIEFYPLPGNPGTTGSNRYAQAIFYYGEKVQKFWQVFGEFCTIPRRA